VHSRPLDHHLVSAEPAPLFLGELPRRWDDVPARVIVNMCGVFPGGDPYGRWIFGMPLIDAIDPQVVPDRGTLERFIDGVHPWAMEHGSYWHCHAGINRSGFAVAAYLHRHRGMRISEAIAHLRQRRSRMVLCNDEYERALRRWYGAPDEQAFEKIPISAWLGVTRETP
jgi:hypothetical protein